MSTFNRVTERCRVTTIRFLMFVTVPVMLTTHIPTNGEASEAEKLITIASITANPLANNRRIVLFKGRANDIRVINGAALGIPTCGQAFTLEDETGSIDVFYIIKCHHQDNTIAVSENDQLLVSATIDAAPSADVQSSKKPDIGFRAMATKLVRVKSE